MTALFWSQNRIVQEIPHNMVYTLPVRDYISACDSAKILEVYGVLHYTYIFVLHKHFTFLLALIIVYIITDLLDQL